MQWLQVQSSMHTAWHIVWTLIYGQTNGYIHSRMEFFHIRTSRDIWDRERIWFIHYVHTALPLLHGKNHKEQEIKKKKKQRARNDGIAGTCPHDAHPQSLLFWAIILVASHFLFSSSNSWFSVPYLFITHTVHVSRMKSIKLEFLHMGLPWDTGYSKRK